MGYQTDFDGVLKFKNEPSMQEIKKINKLMNFLDPDEHPEFLRNPGDKLSYIQFELTDDIDGIKWDGSEKFYNAVEAVNFILLNMRAEFPDFGFTGELLARGESAKDVWKLAIVDGKAVRVDISVGDSYECPHCREEFLLSEAKKVA